MVLLALSEGSLGLIAVLLGGGFLSALAALRKVGPERASTVVGYQSEVIDDLNEERERLKDERNELRKKYEELRSECGELRERVEALERERRQAR